MHHLYNYATAIFLVKRVKGVRTCTNSAQYNIDIERSKVFRFNSKKPTTVCFIRI